MAGTVSAGRAVLTLSVDDRAVASKLKGLERSMRNVGRNMRSVGASFGAVGAAITGPLTLAVLKASEAEETFSKFNTVFGENAVAMKDWSDNMATAMGRAKVETAAAVAGFQDLLVPMGLAPEAATEMSKTLTTLAVDLASFNNKADADVVRDLTAALTGSGETMKKYGVIVSATAVEQELMNAALYDQDAVVTEAMKAQARLAIIMRGTTAAQGDAIRTADGFANTMKRLQSEISNTAVELGNVFLPLATTFVTWLADSTRLAVGWIEENKTLALTIGIVGASLTAIGATLFVLGTAITGIASAIYYLNIAMAFLARNPVILWVIGITAAIAALGALLYWAADALGLINEEVAAVSQNPPQGLPGGFDAAEATAQAEAVAAKVNASLQALPSSAAPGAGVPTKPTDIDKKMLKELGTIADIAYDQLQIMRQSGGLLAGAF